LASQLTRLIQGCVAPDSRSQPGQPSLSTRRFFNAAISVENEGEKMAVFNDRVSLSRFRGISGASNEISHLAFQRTPASKTWGKWGYNPLFVA
jgi:hypothetical protein